MSSEISAQSGLKVFRAAWYVDHQSWFDNINETQIQYDIDQIAQSACYTHLVIPVRILQESPESNFPKALDSYEFLGSIAKSASQRRLKLIIVPTLILQSTGVVDEINPSDPALWFQNWAKALIQIVEVVQAVPGGIDVFLLGSEINEMEKPHYRPYWEGVIRQIRQVYHGILSYQTNFWWSPETYARASFGVPWDKLDIIGVNGYFELTNKTDASVAQLQLGWRFDRHKQDIVSQIRRLILLYQKPVVFWEIGYQSKDGTTIEPWNFLKVAPVDEQEQAQAYEAFGKVFAQELSVVGFGIFVHKVGLPKEDVGYDIIGKPAQKEVKKITCGG